MRSLGCHESPASKWGKWLTYFDGKIRPTNMWASFHLSVTCEEAVIHLMHAYQTNHACLNIQCHETPKAIRLCLSLHTTYK